MYVTRCISHRHIVSRDVESRRKQYESTYRQTLKCLGNVFPSCSMIWGRIYVTYARQKFPNSTRICLTVYILADFTKVSKVRDISITESTNRIYCLFAYFRDGNQLTEEFRPYLVFVFLTTVRYIQDDRIILSILNTSVVFGQTI